MSVNLLPSRSPPVSRSLDSFGCRTALPGFPALEFFSLKKLAESYPAIHSWPRAKLILLENLLRHENGTETSRTLIESYLSGDSDDTPIPFFPARVLMQDYAGISALVDIAGLRNVLEEHGVAADSISPVIPVDLVVDHSLQVNSHGSSGAPAENLMDEYRLNKSRYEFLRWAEQSISNLRVVPPGRGIVHQVNVEVLSTGTRVKHNEIFFDTLVGTDSHTPMVNGLGILGWGVGGIEALAAMLGQPLWLSTPRVTGVRLIGEVPAGVYAADIALNLTAFLRRIGVVGNFLEFFGPGSASLSVFDKSTIANMTPEYGATCSLFPVTQSTLDYLGQAKRSDLPGESADALRAYLDAQGMLDDSDQEPLFDRVVEFDLGAVQPSFSGPSRPDQVHGLSELTAAFLSSPGAKTDNAPAEAHIRNGAIAIAAITSCTNTANPKSMLAAGLVARKAIALGLRVPSHVKCSFTPGSIAVDRYLDQAGLLEPLNQLGFNLAGYGCATCVGNSGELKPEVQQAIDTGGSELVLASVLSGNRNFESRIHPSIGANFLMSPALVVVLAIAG
ncbi:aconitase family protein, partial [Herbaspirillum lusitanum]|uniref:aconitase family protein n=1 Tax=Herbaspirillum lusitanum TaxID=213312 RepID=UPI001EE66DA5